MVLNGLPTSGVLICSFFYRTMGMLDQVNFYTFYAQNDKPLQKQPSVLSPHVPNKWSISFYLTFLLLPYTLLDEFKTKCRCYVILSIKTSVCFFIKHLFGEKKSSRCGCFKCLFRWLLKIIYLLCTLGLCCSQAFSSCRARALGHRGFSSGTQA